MISTVNDIKLPDTNIYFENSSADGFAFLGYARAKAGLGCDYLYDAVKKRNFCLNSSQTIRKVTVAADNQYVYTIWVCIEFLSLINKDDDIEDLISRVDAIGQYPNKMMRYCSTEVHYLVPNVTSAAALIYSMAAQKDKAIELVQVLRDKQKGGNWEYYDLRANKPVRFEDSYHLAMMVYHLREIKRISGIDTEDLVSKSIVCLNKMNAQELQGGSIGWGIPMLYVATKGIDDKLNKRAYNGLMSESINNTNFRVRAIAAWALAKENLNVD